MARASKMQLAIYHTIVIILALLTSEIAARSKDRSRRKSRLQYTDCGNQDRIIHFHHLRATPSPVVIPGTLYLSIAGHVSEDLPRRVNVYLTLKKYFFSFPLKLPCFSHGVGSCTYENICATLEQFDMLGCPESLRAQGIPCTCPFLAGEFSVSDVALNLPKIEGFASTFLTGRYELKMVVQEEDGPELGCLKVNFSLRKRNQRKRKKKNL